MNEIKLPIEIGDELDFRLAEEDSGSFTCIEIIDSAKDEALLVPTDTIAYAIEMASFVVNACNAYPALVEACRATVKANQALTNDDRDTRLEHAARLAEAALH